MDTQTQIDILTRRLDALSNSSVIPRDVEKAFRQRLGLNSYTGTIVTAPLGGGGTQGNMVFRNGILISQVQAT